MGEMIKVWFIGLYVIIVVAAGATLFITGVVWLFTSAPYSIVIVAVAVFLPLLVGRTWTK